MQDDDPSPPFPVAAGFYPGTCPFGTSAGRRTVRIAASPNGSVADRNVLGANSVARFDRLTMGGTRWLSMRP